LNCGELQQYFHADWPNREIYHTMFNTYADEEAEGQAILNLFQQRHSTTVAAD
jgi:hypothetical protein